jgi:hypothetical protein
MAKQMERSYFPGRLYDSFKKVKSSRLVSRHEVDDDSIRHFEHYLNASVALSEREMGAREIIRACFQDLGYKHFFRLIKKNKMECTVLYLDPRSIITYLNLIGLVFLSFDEEANAFSANAIVRPAIKDVLSFTPISWIEDVETYIKERDARMNALMALKADIEELDTFITKGLANEDGTAKDLKNSVTKAKANDIVTELAGQSLELLIASGVASGEVAEAVQEIKDAGGEEAVQVLMEMARDSQDVEMKDEE